MKGKYLLVVMCMLVSLSAIGQRKRGSYPAPDQKKDVHAVLDTAAMQDTAHHVEADIIPENAELECSSILQLLKDAAADFSRIKGKEIETVSNGTRYTSMGGIPGSITSNLMRLAGKWQYEGVMYQGGEKDVKEAYEKYKGILISCLGANGYESTTGKASNTKTEEYPERKFTKAKEEKGDKHNPRATLKVDYTPGADLYVVTISIWSN